MEALDMAGRGFFDVVRKSPHANVEVNLPSFADARLELYDRCTWANLIEDPCAVILMVVVLS